MFVYIFSSTNLTNIWAGIGAGRWAVSSRAASLGVVQSNARRFPIGGLGLFYCSEVKGFTTPFLVLEKPDPKEVIAEVWHEPWHLPFAIHPFGSPRRILSSEKALTLLPTMQAAGKSKWTQVMHIQATLAFQPTTLTDTDWGLVIQELVA
jgi:hypothetical protein